jgi:hypothetical protein
MDTEPSDKIIIEHLQTLRFSTISNMPLGMQEHTMIQKLISEERAITNARNRLNYNKRKAEGRNHQIKSPSTQLQPKGRKPKAITVDDINKYVSTQAKAKKSDTNIR